MDTQLLNEVIACLPKGKTHYRYFKGAYAPRLLTMLMPKQASIHSIKKTRFGRLLEQPLLKSAVANCGDGRLTQETLSSLWCEPSLPFLLTVSRWGGKRERDWFQTSRFGENLVLQLNLPAENTRKLRTLVDSEGEWTINGRYSSHPVQMHKRERSFRDTLGWSRIDVDFEHNEALIEEVQSDGVRNIRRWARYHRGRENLGSRRILEFCQWFERYQPIWAEAMLLATIEFIQHELGVNRIFMHTARSGWRVKKMDKDWHAPRSLYTDLPRKFLFKRTFAAPEFLLQERCYKQLIRKNPDIDFYQLSMDELKESLTSTSNINQSGDNLCHVA